MSRKRIFVSCGQLTDDEKALGKQVINVIAATGRMEGFFANEAHDATDLNSSLFRELQSCDGFVAIIQSRGKVRSQGRPAVTRGSVWIHQEIAILFYRSFLLGRPVPMRIYMEKSIAHEGLTQFSMINPRDFEENNGLLSDLRTWISGPTFEETPVLARREDIFRRLTANYEDHHWLLLEIVAANSSESGARVDRPFLSKAFLEIVHGGKSEDLSSQEKSACRQYIMSLIDDGVLEADRDERRQVSVCSIKTQWWDLIHDELRNRSRIK